MTLDTEDNPEVIRLRRELADKEAEIEALRQVRVGDHERFVGVAGFTAMEARFVALIASRDRVSKEAAFSALYDHGSDDPPAPKIVDIWLHRVRRKLKPYGVTIETIWGFGFQVSAEGRKRLHEIADAAQAAREAPASTEETAAAE